MMRMAVAQSTVFPKLTFAVLRSFTFALFIVQPFQKMLIFSPREKSALFCTLLFLVIEFLTGLTVHTVCTFVHNTQTDKALFAFILKLFNWNIINFDLFFLGSYFLRQLAPCAH